MIYNYNKRNVTNAQELRKNMTPEEKQLWYDFLKRLPVTVNKQKNIGDYIVDFFIANKRIVIELDGSQHYDKKGIVLKDKIRTEKLEERKLTVIRIPNNEIWNNFDGVCEYIDNYIKRNIK